MNTKHDSKWRYFFFFAVPLCLLSSFSFPLSFRLLFRSSFFFLPLSFFVILLLKRHKHSTYRVGDARHVLLGDADAEVAQVGLVELQHHHALDLHVFQRAVARALEGDLFINAHMDTK